MISQQHYKFYMTPDRQQLGIDTSVLFPCLCFDVDIRRNVCHEIPWHWHPEIEVDVITHGRVLLEAGGKTWELKPGDGLFLNTNVCHGLQALGAGPCRFHSLAFTAEVLAGAPGSVFEQRYVRPMLASSARVMVLRSEVPWQREAVAAANDAYDAFAREDFGWELLARGALSRFWQLAAKHADLSQAAEEEPADVRRLKIMFQCIRENFSRPLTLEDIAASANIGKRECLRCFRRTVGVAPIQCLMKYRIRQATRMLVDTDLSVTEIGLRCGFENPSYFAQTFRRLTGLTPREYRKTGRAAEDPGQLDVVREEDGFRRAEPH